MPQFRKKAQAVGSSGDQPVIINLALVTQPYFVRVNVTGGKQAGFPASYLLQCVCVVCVCVYVKLRSLRVVALRNCQVI